MFIPPRNVTLGNDNESWNNLNIQRDPTKGIFTQYRNKRHEREVYEFEKEYSRYDENIEKFSRGKDPFQKVQMNNTVGGKQAYKPITNQILRVSKPTEYELLPLSRLPHDYYNYNTKKAVPIFVQSKSPIEKRMIQETLQPTVNNTKSVKNYGDMFRKLMSLPNFKLTTNLKDSIHTKKHKSIMFDNLRSEKPTTKLSNVLQHPINSNKYQKSLVNMKPLDETKMIHDTLSTIPIATNKSKDSTLSMKIGELPKNFIDENSMQIQSISRKNLKNETPLRIHHDKDMMKNNTLQYTTNTNKVSSLHETPRSNNQSIKLNELYNTTSLVTPKVYHKLSKLRPESGKNNIKSDKLMVQTNTQKKYYQIIKNKKSGLEQKELPKRILHSSVVTSKAQLNGNTNDRPTHFKLNPIQLENSGRSGNRFIPTKIRDVNVPPSHLRKREPLKLNSI